MSCAAGARTLEAKDGQGARPFFVPARARFRNARVRAGGASGRIRVHPLFFFRGGGAGTDYGGKREACPPVKIRARPRKFAFPCSRESPLLQSAGRFFAGVRGVAALVVLGFHVFEAFATSPFDQTFNHGYLAVDFFFMLSGFVIGYAYDARWRGNGNAGGMTTADFFKRRLVRLHPMICVGALLGVVSFFVQGRVRWDGTEVGVPAVALAFLLSIFLIPARPGTAAEISGNGEMFPLNGPSWSLFFEYLGNIFYALVLRRLPTAALAAFVALAALGLTGFAAGNLSGFGHIGVGWSLADFDVLKNTDNGAIGELFDNGLCGGLLRLGFSFPAGLLLARVFRPAKIRGAFWICAGCVAALLSAPYVGGEADLLKNGLYDAFCVIFAFPCIVFLGASGSAPGAVSEKICRFLGDISYPVYIIHYPSFYLFYAWFFGSGRTFADAWPAALPLVAGNVLAAYLFLKFFDEPLRRRLARLLKIGRRG